MSTDDVYWSQLTDGTGGKLYNYINITESYYARLLYEFSLSCAIKYNTQLSNQNKDFSFVGYVRK